MLGGGTEGHLDRVCGHRLGADLLDHHALMSHPSLASAASPKARLNFLLDEPAPRRSAVASARLPDRGRAREGVQGVRALSADAVLGAAPGGVAHHQLPSAREWASSGQSTRDWGVGQGGGVGRDWTPGARAHSADSLSSGASDAAPRSDSSEGGSLSGASGTCSSPALRPLPAPTLLPAAHLLQATAYGGLLAQYATAPSTQAAQAQAAQAPMHAPPPLQNHAPPPPASSHLAPGAQMVDDRGGYPPHHQSAPHGHSQHAGSPHMVDVAGGSAAGGPRRALKTEAEMRQRHDQRKMKNRISAAASRDRKKRSFTNLQRSLQDAELRYSEAKRVIETLTLQLEQERTRLASGDGGAAAVPVPHDLRDLVGGKDFVEPHVLLDVLRHITRR